MLIAKKEIRVFLSKEIYDKFIIILISSDGKRSMVRI